MTERPNRCKHGMDARFCAVCIPASPVPLASAGHRKRLVPPTPVEAREALARTIQHPWSYALVRTNGSSQHRLHSSFAALRPEVEKVHIDGHPFHWAIEVILKRCPNLKTLQVIPSMLERLSNASETRRMLAERGIAFVGGHHRPELVWDRSSGPRDPRYDRLRKIVLARRDVLDELCELGFEMAIFTRRYYCLDGEEYRNYRQIATDLGLSPHEAALSAYVNAVLHYLDPNYEVIDRSKQHVRAWRVRVERLRALRANTTQMRELLDRLELSAWPEGLPLARIDAYERVLMRWRAVGGFDTLDDRERFVLIARFGLDGQPIRKLFEIGQIIPGTSVSRERVRQIEEQALLKLGMIDEILKTDKEATNE